MNPELPPLAFVDLETTGGTAGTDRITEVAIVTLAANGSVTRWSTLVDPETRIPSFIERLTGISNAMVAGAPRFAAVADEVLARLAGTLFVAHNARFDYGFLKHEFKRLGVAFRMPVLCTVKLSRKLYPQFRQHGLDQLIDRHRLQVSARHRAQGDAQAICDFWQLACAEFGQTTVQAAVKELTARPNLPPHLDPEVLDELPEGCGVYLFYGENELPLYVGKSTRIRSRVLSHFAADPSDAKAMRIVQQVRRIETIECAGELEALLNEARLVKELQPTLNRQLRRNREYCAWLLVDRGLGLLQAELVQALELPFGRQHSLYGVFSSSRAAHERLHTIARDHELCLATLGLEKADPGKPCFARQIERCRGACVGEESFLQHGIRLLAALGPLKLVAWPFAGPAILPEGEVAHLIDGWCYLGTARDDADLERLLADGEPQFDRDTYRILVRHLDRLRPMNAGAVH